MDDSDSKVTELIAQYGAEPLPEDVKDIIPDFFMESLHVSEQIEVVGGFDYVDSFEENYGQPSGFENGEVNSIVTPETGIPRSVLNNLDDIPEKLTDSCDVFDEYFRDGCGCNRKCHERFPKFMAFEAHLDALDADQYCPDHINHQHLLLLGAMNALVQNHPTTIAKEHRPKDRKNARTQFRFRGQEVCRKFFLFIFGCGEKRVKNVMKQFLSSGISPKAHESAQSTKSLVKSLPNEQRTDAVIFIRNYAQQHALQLPGRYITSEGAAKDLFLLPAVANMTRKYIYDQYLICCRDLRKDGISFALWGALWDWLCPNVMVPKNRNEICRECREHQYIISKPEPLNDNRKLKSTEKYIHHLNLIHHELSYYKSCVDVCRESLQMAEEQQTTQESVDGSATKSYPGSMHYTFDWYTTVSLPFSSRLSSIYFRDPYKVTLFGVSCEPIGKFILYIIPEFVCSKSSDIPDITVSLVNHFFTNFALGETHTYVHFGDNSVQQCKNNHLLAYFMWRSVTGLNEKITLSFMPSGHSRCWNDLFMGVFKKKFRNCDINCLSDVYQIAERCCGPSNSITPVLVGNDNGDIIFPLFDWNEKFSRINNLDIGILMSNNHFEISTEVPGLVLCRRLVNSDTISYALIASEDLEAITDDLPPILEIEGLSNERKQYLHHFINEFVPDKYKSILIPDNFEVDVTQPEFTGLHNIKSSSKCNKKLKLATKQQEETKPSSKRKRAGPPKCSYCKAVGHRERIFGKTTCPKKKRDSLLLTNNIIGDNINFIVNTESAELESGDHMVDQEEAVNSQLISVAITDDKPNVDHSLEEAIIDSNQEPIVSNDNSNELN